MRGEHFASAQPERASIGPGTLILAAIGCFTLGFGALMAVPRFMPRYVQATASVTPTPAPQPIEVGIQSPPPPAPSVAVPGVIQTIGATAAPMTQKIAGAGALTTLAECRAVIRAGAAYGGVGPEQMTAMFGTRGKPLTSTQLDAGCRKLTE